MGDIISFFRMDEADNAIRRRSRPYVYMVRSSELCPGYPVQNPPMLPPKPAHLRLKIPEMEMSAFNNVSLFLEPQCTPRF